MKAGKGKVVAKVEVPAFTQTRMESGLSQANFAKLLSTYATSVQTNGKASL
jgi:DNA-binding transcriptional regulator YiaG